MFLKIINKNLLKIMNNKLSVSLLALNNINHIDEFLLVLRKEKIPSMPLGNHPKALKSSC